MRRPDDPIDLLQAANRVPDPNRLPDGPETLLDEIIGTTVAEQPAREHSRRPLVVLTSSFAVVLAVTAVWVFGSPEETTQISCNRNVTIDARSGDPVADCAAELRRQGIEPGILVAYVTQFGGVAVLEKGSHVPLLWQRLEDGFTQDTAIIKLREALHDISTGVVSGCYSNDEATLIVERELAASGLDWEIATRSHESLIPPTCATAMVIPEDQQVLVAQQERRGGVPLGQVEEWQSQNQAIDALAARVNMALDNECLTLNDAAKIAVDITFSVGAEYMTEIQTVDEPAAACTTSVINGGGSMFLILRGPADGPIDPIALPKPWPERSAVAATPYSVAVEVWSTFVDEALETIGFDNPHAGYKHAGVSWGQDGSANAEATDAAGHRLFLAYEPWISDNASADPKKLQRVLGMPNPGTVVREGVLFIEETTYVITVKLAVPEGVISASIHVGTITSRSGELDAELLSALVRTASPIARELLGADPDQLEFVNYLPHAEE